MFAANGLERIKSFLREYRACNVVGRLHQSPQYVGGRSCNIAIHNLPKYPRTPRTLLGPVLQYCNSAISPPGSTGARTCNLDHTVGAGPAILQFGNLGTGKPTRVRATGMIHRLTKRNSSGSTPNCKIAGPAPVVTRIALTFTSHPVWIHRLSSLGFNRLSRLPLPCRAYSDNISHCPLHLKSQCWKLFN